MISLSFVYIFLVLDKDTLVGMIQTSTCSDFIFPASFTNLPTQQEWRTKTFRFFIIVCSHNIMLVDYYNISIVTCRMDHHIKLPVVILDRTYIIAVFDAVVFANSPFPIIISIDISFCVAIVIQFSIFWMNSRSITLFTCGQYLKAGEIVCTGCIHIADDIYIRIISSSAIIGNNHRISIHCPCNRAHTPQYSACS